MSFENQWRSPPAEELRQAHLQGEKHSFCQRCWDEEKAGFFSRRLAELKVDSNYWQEVQTQNWKQGPEVMVFKISNLCNFACRTCYTGDSSKYVREADYYKKEYGAVDSRVSDVSHGEFSAEELENITSYSSNLKRLEFYGGEPMMNKTHEIFLKRLIEMGRAGEITLYYNTNGSFYPSYERIQLWKEFKEIQMTFSLDGINENFHYIRWPGNWKETKERLVRYRDELPQVINKNVMMSCNTTVSLLNIFNLDEIATELAEIFDRRFAVTVVHDPAYYSIKNLPPEVKTLVKEKLELAKHKRWSDVITSYMLGTDWEPKEFQNFIDWTKRKDRYRKLSFKECFPEYYQILEKYFHEPS